MSASQPGILSPLPAHGKYLFFAATHFADPARSLSALAEHCDGEKQVVGLGSSLIQTLGIQIEGLRPFPAIDLPGKSIPSTGADLWVWLRGTDRGELLHESQKLEQLLIEDFSLVHAIDAFMYRDSRDLTGYIDGTENPDGDDAIKTAIVSDKGPGIDGSSYVAVQQWLHDLSFFNAMPQQQKDHTIGRRLSDNEEIDDAPESAHVKRTAQESFDPEAFILRRSMPWSESNDAGLVFVAFGHNLDAFETLLKHMAGLDDGIIDAMFDFSTPLTGAYFWCPPVSGGQLDLSAVEINS